MGSQVQTILAGGRLSIFSSKNNVVTIKLTLLVFQN